MSGTGLFPLLSARGVGRALARRADRLRDAKRFREAAQIYEEALLYLPKHSGMHVQCGHMHKENGAFSEAEHHYLIAAEHMPNDPDLALQLGHFFKVTGNIQKSRASYERALTLKPGWPEAKLELERLDAGSTASFSADSDSGMSGEAPELAAEGKRQAQLLAAAAAGRPLQQDLLPRHPNELLHEHREGIEVRRLGRPARGYWGTRTTLRGIEAIRGFCIADTPVAEIMILRNGSPLHRGPVSGGYPLRHEARRGADLRKYVFNIWLDFSAFPTGPCSIEIRAIDARGRSRSHHDEIVIAEPLGEADMPDLDGLVSIDPDDPRSIDDQINSRPTMVRPARRALLPKRPETILVQRVDQLGDMVVSVPALRRLRQLFPDSKIVGLLSNANVDLAKSLGLFDDMLVIDFPEDMDQRRRVMPIEKQEELLRMYASYRFDMAIDLSENAWSRRVLLLSGAPFLYGFRAGSDVPGLNVDLEGNTHNRLNNHEVVPHTNKVLGMVEWLAALARTSPNIVPRTQPSEAFLKELGLSTAGRYAVLHDGARLHVNRWPHFPALAERILTNTDLQVAMLIDDQRDREALPAALLASDRFKLMPHRMGFDMFDAMLANCAVFVGNDSGPKHLASFRGSQVISLHSARSNWNEWGQENTGVILSRKVPCAGCLIHYDPEECGRDFACLRDIAVDEVFGAVLAVLADNPPGVAHG